GALRATRPARAAAKSQETEAQTLRREIDQLRSDFEALRQEYGQRLSTLETRLAGIQGGQTPPPGGRPGGAAAPSPAQTPAGTSVPTAQVPPGAEGAGGPTGALPGYRGGAAAAQIF